MTPDELRARCTQAHDQLMTFDLPATHEASETLYLRNMEILKSLCREMIVEGRLQMIHEVGDLWDNGDSKNHEFVGWCRQEAQRVKDDGA